MKRHDIKIAESDELPRGNRATWERRGQLCAAKLAGKIDKDTQPDDFAALLMGQGRKPEEDEFVEVHIWGPMTVRTIEKVVYVRRRKAYSQTILKSLKRKLQKFNVDLEIR